ncbi:MAG: hypothetical protein Q8Q40_09240 [Methylococcaceae bacterium]|nr:hypothetical protein [Methylococcaceae bacterium]
MFGNGLIDLGALVGNYAKEALIKSFDRLSAIAPALPYLLHPCSRG